MSVKTKKMALMIGLILVINTYTLSAQITANINFYSSYDDNAFRNYEEIVDRIDRFSFYLAKNWENETYSTRLFYNGNLSLSDSYPDRSYYFQYAGLAYIRLWSKFEHVFSAGINYASRYNKDTYNYYDYSQFSGYLNFKYYLTNWLSQGGYQVTSRDYLNLPEFSYWEHFLYIRFSHFFPTRTSIFLEADYGYKNYVAQQMVEFNSTNRGRGMGRDEGVSSYEIDTPGTSQWIGSIKVSQSLTNSTGVNLKLLKRWNPDGNRYIAGLESSYMTDDDLFDSPYSYESWELSSMFTQRLPWKVTLKSGAYYLLKNYNGQTVLNLEDNSLLVEKIREDTRIVGWIDMTKSFYFSSNIMKNVNLNLNFTYQKNDSNNLYYNYINHILSVGLTTRF